jgi:hypothetical protein
VCDCNCKGKNIRIVVTNISSGSSHDTSCISFGDRFSVHSVMSYINPGIPNEMIDQMKNKYEQECDDCVEE